MDEILTIIEAIIKETAITACKSYLLNAQNLCEPLIEIIFEAVSSLLDKIIKNIAEVE